MAGRWTTSTLALKFPTQTVLVGIAQNILFSPLFAFNQADLNHDTLTTSECEKNPSFYIEKYHIIFYSYL